MIFDELVDTANFHEWFYCIDRLSHDALHDSLSGGMMGMGHHHDDSIAFYDRMHDRARHGEFEWNESADSCVFRMDEGLIDDTEYVLRLRYAMRNKQGAGMRHMGGEFSDDLTIRFRTQRP